MTLALEFLVAFLLAALLLTLYRILYGRLLAGNQQGTVPVFAVVPAAGDGDGLEQTLRHLTWLREERLSAFTILIVDAGLSDAGRETTKTLLRKDSSLLFCPAEEATLILQRKDRHGYFSL